MNVWFAVLLPLPLGEGWGEGLRMAPQAFTPDTLTLPSPEGRGF
jgi:hypothetical protein